MLTSNGRLRPLTRLIPGALLGLGIPVLIGACQNNTPARAADDGRPNAGVVKRGAEVPDGPRLSVQDAFAKAKTLDGALVTLKGRVSSVCQAKGCWMVLRDANGAEGTETIRMTAKDYGFFVPKNAQGALATVHGTLEVKTLSEEEQAHLAAESEGDAPSAVEIRIVAHGVEIES